MIRFIDTNSTKSGRTFYEALVMYDHRYANKHALPLDEKFIEYDSDMYYLISSDYFYVRDSDELNPRILSLAKQNKIKLLFDFSFEADWRGIQSFIDYMEKQRVPKESWLAITGGDMNGHEMHPQVCHCPMFEIKARYCVQENLVHNFGVNQHKKFLCLNARPRPHRVALMYQLSQRKLLEHGYCTLPHERGNFIEDYNLKNNIAYAIQQGIDISVSHLYEFQVQLPFELDDTSQANSLILNDSVLGDIYSYVDFVVVTESMVSTGDNMVFITEKTMKAIANKKPFIVLGDPGTLEYMRSIGYKTYDFLIDESYDTMPYGERVNKIASEIERLCKVDFGKFQDQIEAVAQHNYDHMMSEETYKPRIEKLINFLTT